MSRRDDARLEDTRAWVYCVLRAGFDALPEISRQVREAVVVDHPDLDPDATTSALIAIAGDTWLGDEVTWPEPTDHDRLQAAFGRLDALGVRVLQGCADHWAAHELLRGPRPPDRGVLWFTPPDVWHAIEAGMLEVNLWHCDTANAAPGDALLDEVLAVLGDAGLHAHFDEGRIEVAASWQRRRRA